MPDRPLSPEEIAANLRLLTHVKDWLNFRDVNQRGLADGLGVSEPTVSKWLRGTQPMSAAQFVKIAEFLDATPEQLLSAPPDAPRAARYQKIAEVAQDMPEDALDEWLSLGRRLSSGGKKAP